MRRILLGAISAVALSTTAFAADLPARTYTKAPAPVAPVYNWGGFYIGLNGGGGSSRDCWSLTNNFGVVFNSAVAEGCHNATGGTVGGQVGYRWQASSWVFGVEAQGNWANFKGSNVNTAPAALNAIAEQTTVRAFGLFTGQVGYAVNNVLFYAKGGAAVANNKYNNITVIAVAPFVAGQPFSQGTETRWGGVAGVGVEFGFAPNWSVAAEYDHMFMGTNNVTLNTLPPFAPGVCCSHNISQDVDIGTIRVNYTFGGPVVAKY
jgi:outer membrane immunogenic protein